MTVTVFLETDREPQSGHCVSGGRLSVSDGCDLRRDKEIVDLPARFPFDRPFRVDEGAAVVAAFDDIELFSPVRGPAARLLDHMRSQNRLHGILRHESVQMQFNCRLMRQPVVTPRNQPFDLRQDVHPSHPTGERIASVCLIISNSRPQGTQLSFPRWAGQECGATARRCRSPSLSPDSGDLPWRSQGSVYRPL